MIKVSQIKIGDYVFHERYGNAIVETISNDFGESPTVKLISKNIKHKDGYEYGFCWCVLEEIFPIPITTEILENNGFTYHDDEAKFYPNTWIGNEIMLKQESDCFRIVVSSDYNDEDTNNTPFVLRHVNDLKDALKLCGIDKEIIL